MSLIEDTFLAFGVVSEMVGISAGAKGWNLNSQNCEDEGQRGSNSRLHIISLDDDGEYRVKELGCGMLPKKWEGDTS